MTPTVMEHLFEDNSNDSSKRICKKKKKKRKTRRTVIKTNRRKPERVFDLFLPRARHFGLVFILLLLSPLPLPLAGLPATGNNKLGKINPKLQLEGAGAAVRVKNCRGSGVNFRAVLVPGIFFPKEQVGCEFIPQLWWSWVGEEMFHLPPLLHQRQEFLTWQVDTAPGAGNFLPFQPSDTHAVFSVVL